jgi:hypothetical protein
MQTPNYMNNTVVVNNNLDNSLDNNSLDANEMAGLLYMREEEKLAHDVYVTLYQQWGLPVFNNIANSETRHQIKVAELLDNYQIPQNIGNNPVGVFVNPDLQQLYNNLVLQGSQSLTEALKVGVLIEETDIADLQARLSQTDNLDIQQVYNNLLNASYNHLNSFSSNLTVTTNDNINPPSSISGQVQPDLIDDPLTGNRRSGGRGNGNNQGFTGNGYGNSFQNNQANSLDNSDCLLTTADPINNYANNTNNYNLMGYVENPDSFVNTVSTNQGVTVMNPVDSYYSPNNFIPNPMDVNNTVSLIPNNNW